MNQEKVSEKEAVLNAVYTFLKGFDEMDPAIIAGAWHNEGTLQYVDSGNIKIINLSDYLNNFEAIKNNPDHLFHKEKGTKKVIDYDITNTAARVKLEWAFPQFVFTDYYSLLKGPDGWKIVTKIWHKKEI